MTHLEFKTPSFAHIDNIMNVVSNEKSSKNTPQHIFRSWHRCINEYNISPDYAFTPHIIEQHDLIEYQDAFSSWNELAQNSLDNLFSIISDIGYTLLLTDKNGIALDCRYRMEDKDFLKQHGLYTGANWSETVAGTNGIGTCIAEEKEMVVDKAEHFFPIMTGMTCVVSPIFDSVGQLVASLNASVLRPSTKGQNHLVAKLVQQYSKQIGMLYFMDNHKKHWLLRFSKSMNTTTDNFTTGILAINEDGIITAANKNAYQHLCKNKNLKLSNCLFNDIFDVSFSTLLDSIVKKSPVNRTLVANDNGEQFFFKLSPPLTGNNHRYSQNSERVETNVKRQSNPKAKSHPELDTLIGEDSSLIKVAENVRKVIGTDLHILITGESGTGKEAWARAIHNDSPRSKTPFIAINCGAIPESLIESELFGYTTGTFTGALKQGMKGKILQANGGTLFLDEIGDMPLHLQTRLLRVLSEHEVVPLGKTSPIHLDIQLLSATNKDISAMIEDNSFRSDLYYRLNGTTINLPTLRDRTDKELLIFNVFNDLSTSNTNDITDEAMNFLMKYFWPGNIRQLINVAKYSIAISSGEAIKIEHFPNDILTDKSNTIEQNTKNCTNENAQTEQERLFSMLKKHKWNITRVSTELNICRATVYRKMRKYNFIPPNEL
jgi:transcriptional regulator of acetoin/glycerol metabolism